MICLDAFSPLSVVFDPDANKIWNCPMSEEKLKEYMKELRKSLDGIHRKVGVSVRSSRATREGMISRNAQVRGLTKEITSWLLLLKLNISPNFSQDGVTLSNH
jgi:hypothetical protein